MAKATGCPHTVNPSTSADSDLFCPARAWQLYEAFLALGLKETERQEGLGRAFSAQLPVPQHPRLLPGLCLTLLCSCWIRSISVLRLHREAGKSGARRLEVRPPLVPSPPHPAPARAPPILTL